MAKDLTYNVNRKIANFGDFTANIGAEKEELKKVRRSTKPNSEDQQHIGNARYKFNKVTRKMDDLSPDMIDDKIEAIEELEEAAKFDFSKMATEYINSEEAEDESWGNEEERAIKAFSKWLNKKHETEPKESYKDKMKRLVDKAKEKTDKKK